MEEKRKWDFDSRNINQPIYALPCNFLLHGRYIVGKVLGQGGFGITYLAWDNLLDMKVAVKEYFPMGMVTRDVSRSASLFWSTSQSDGELRQKGYNHFLKEARKMAKIDNVPSIVRVRDFFLDNETAYIVMDYVEGITLKETLLKNGVLSFEDCVRLLHPIMEGLAKAHSHQIIHRDISPDNIMIQKDGSVILLDLGAAKDMTDANGQRSQLVAKGGFSPMEQYMQNKTIGPWTDVYALCATIYYCVTGNVLKTALERIDDETVLFPPEADGRLSEREKNVLKHGLAVKPEERIQSMDELLKELDGIEKTAPEKMVQEEALQKGSAKKAGDEKKIKFALAGAGILLVTAVCFSTIYANHQDNPEVLNIASNNQNNDEREVDTKDFEETEEDNSADNSEVYEDDRRSSEETEEDKNDGNSTAQEDDINNFEFEEYDDHVVITSYTGTNTSVVFPSEINGKPVTQIGNEDLITLDKETVEQKLFSTQIKASITDVTIPDSVTEIGNWAFAFTGITNITIPDSVTTIGGYTFAKCTSLTNVTIPDSVTVIGGFAFFGCTSLKTVEISKNTEYDSAFDPETTVTFR